MDWAALPKAALMHILSCHSTLELSRSALLVCRSWLEAADAVIRTRQELALDSISDSSSFERFLSRRVRHLQQLHLYSLASSSALKQLPCPLLQDLLLHNGFLQLGQRSDPDSLVSSLLEMTALTSLDLQWVCCLGQDYTNWLGKAADADEPLAAVTAMSRLQYLSLQDIVVHSCHVRNQCRHFEEFMGTGDVYNWEDGAKLPAGFMQHLPDLSFLTVDIRAGGGVSEDSLQQLGLATKLQHLQLSWVRKVSAAVLEGLPELQQLTFLELGELWQDLTVSTCPEFSTLTSLQHLHLHWGFPGDSMMVNNPPEYWLFQPSLLSGMSKLQVLSLYSAEMLSLDAAAAATELLEAVRGMQQLVSLALQDIHSLGGCPPQAYSALTASSSLEYLSIHWCSLSNDPAIWQHTFAAGRPRTQLRTLRLTALGHFLEGVRLDSAALASIAASCVRLHSLDLSHSGDDSMQLQLLRQLQHLTQLCLGTNVSDTDAADTLTHMTRLQALRLASTRRLTDSGLLQLTVLQGITQLGLGLGSECALSKQFVAAVQINYDWEYSDDPLNNSVYVISSNAPPGTPPDVWQQVQDMYSAG